MAEVKGLEADDYSTINVKIKIGMIGESHVWKKALMVKYVEDKFAPSGEEYLETLGVNFMEKTIKIRKATVTLSI